MSIISKETFDKFTEEEKAKIRNEYLSDKKNHDDRYFEGSIDTFEELFGKENLQPEPEIKTWRDIEEYHTNVDIELGDATKSLDKYSQCPIQLLRKCIATLKIDKLIELGYGGIVTKEEWKDYTIPKFCIVPNRLNKGFHRIKCETLDEMRFIGFHTEEQIEEFVSYPENVELVKQYYMI